MGEGPSSPVASQLVYRLKFRCFADAQATVRVGDWDSAFAAIYSVMLAPSYRRLHDTKWINRLLIMLGLVVLTLASIIGEDALEKPFNIVPYYCFCGVILRVGFTIRMVEANSRRDKYDTRQIGVCLGSRPARESRSKDPLDPENETGG
jgi:hypothetical protein